MTHERSIAAVIAAVIGACHPPGRDEWVAQGTDGYAGDKLWLCRPDLPHDTCHVDLTTTELHADGTRTIVKRAPAVDPDVDCFYIYPTVDLHLRAGNHTDFNDIDRVRKTARAQIAQFAEACAVYVPLYRQVTIGSYLDSDKERYFDVAYSDVVAAFRYYLEHYNRGHRIVMIGHSQGAQMLERLLADTFDRDEALRAKLVVAMPIGFAIHTPTGATVGGSFQHLASCATDEQIGCVVAYQSFAAGDVPGPNAWELPAGHSWMCVDPAGTGRGLTPLHTYLPAEGHGVATPYVSYPDFYQARCAVDPGGHDFLEISEVKAPGDKRSAPIEIEKRLGGLGLHIYDFQLPQGDLIELVKKKLAAPPSR